MIHCILLVNRQGKVRLMKWYDSFLIHERPRYINNHKKNKKQTSNNDNEIFKEEKI